MLVCNRVLAPTDFSEAGNRAVHAAAEVAQRFDADLHVLHIVSPQVYYMEMPEMMLPSLEDFTAEMRASGERRLKDLANELGRAERVHTHVQESAERPATAICAFAGGMAVDLIVIGSHGHTGLMHLLLGATAEHVVREAACPVLVIKPPKQDG